MNVHIKLATHGSFAGPYSARLGGRENWQTFQSEKNRIEVIISEAMQSLSHGNPTAYDVVLANLWACNDLDEDSRGTRVTRFRKRRLLEISTCIGEGELSVRNINQLAVVVAKAAICQTVIALAADGLDYSSLNQIDLNRGN